MGAAVQVPRYHHTSSELIDVMQLLFATHIDRMRRTFETWKVWKSLHQILIPYNLHVQKSIVQSTKHSFSRFLKLFLDMLDINQLPSRRIQAMDANATCGKPLASIGLENIEANRHTELCLFQLLALASTPLLSHPF